MRKIIMMDYAGGHIPCAAMKGEFYGKERIADLMKLFRDVGFDAVWFRTSFCGTVCYHSKVLKPFEAEYRLYLSKALARAMAEFDPLEVAIAEAHKCGLKILTWITPFDNYYPGIEDPVLARHPEWLLSSRDGRYSMRGVPCVACAEYMDMRIDEVREVMQYGADGVYHAWGTHTVCTQAEGDLNQPECFGFNEPILQEYHQRFGQPRGDYDYSLIAEIHADYFDRFIESCSKVVRSKSGQYVTMTTSGVLTTREHDYYKYTPDGPIVFRLPSRWQKWAENGWLDAILAVAEGGWLEKNEQAAKGDIPVIGYMHAGWGAEDPNLPLAAQTDFLGRAGRCLREPFGGLALQESDSIEANAPQLWEDLKRLFRA
jgi:hypothetical protein